MRIKKSKHLILLTSILLISLSLLGFLFRVPIFSRFSLYLGPLFLLLLKPVLGKKTSLVLSWLIFLFLWFVLPIQGELLIKVIELSFLILVQKNTRVRKSFLLWDFIFWILCIFLLNQIYIREGLIQSFSEANLFYILLACNGFLNAAFADFLSHNPIGAKVLGHKEKVTLFYLEDLIFQATMIILSFSFIIYLALAITNFEEGINETAENIMNSHYESLLFNFDQIPKQYKLYAQLGKESGIYYVKKTIDAYSFSEGTIHIALKDGSIYPEIYQNKSFQLTKINTNFYQIEPTQDRFLLKNILTSTSASYLYVNETSYGKILIQLPFQFFFNNAYHLYLGQLPYLVLLMIIGLALIRIIIHQIFRSYHQIIDITADLPARIQNRQLIKWPSFKVYEFSVLIKHFQEMTSQLIEQFEEGEAINEELSQQALNLLDSESKLREIALTDMLTQIPNRTHFQNFLEQLLHQSPMPEFAVVFIDLDRFKQINDTYGHSIGDLLLKKVAQKLKAPFQSAYGKTHMTARLGGDEFVLLISYQEYDQLDQLLRSLLSDLNQPMELEEHRLYCVASFGVALFPKHGKDQETLLKKADASMYASKASGGNKITYYYDEIRLSYQENLTVEFELHEAFQKEQFHLYYQPIFDIQNQQYISFEGLLRWQHPEKGLLESKEFINEAARSGMLEELGEYVLSQVCKDQKKWSEDGLCQQPVFINLTHYQLENQSLRNQLQQLLEMKMVNTKCIAFDISQETLYENTKTRLAQLKQIRQLGFSLCLDNFGRVDTSLTYLQKEIFDYVKISGNLYPKGKQFFREDALLKSIHHYCHQVDIKMIYKDIENEELLQWIRDLSPQYLQGYHIASAMEHKDIDLLKRKGDNNEK